MSESIPFSPVPVDEEGVIHVSAVVLADGAGRVLQVRKAGTEAFMFPGGKPEAGETYLLAAVLEVAEETALTLAPSDLTCLGLRRTSAANEEGQALAAAVYAGPVLADDVAAGVTVHDEIEELAWVSPSDVDEEGSFPGGRLAPLSVEVLRERP
ncbi:NUDIX hydrolase [Actinomyces haliotis]|uniref:NUDIX hydrolase n=1 Tax=Actinomyces haliotis TaxID=1280843 RepID=UPI00188DD7E1|nr:NUDIX domain-containing protein [Actinomyces haliotis]